MLISAKLAVAFLLPDSPGTGPVSGSFCADVLESS